MVPSTGGGSNNCEEAFKTAGPLRPGPDQAPYYLESKSPKKAQLFKFPFSVSISQIWAVWGQNSCIGKNLCASYKYSWRLPRVEKEDSIWMQRYLMKSKGRNMAGPKKGTAINN